MKHRSRCMTPPSAYDADTSFADEGGKSMTPAEIAFGFAVFLLAGTVKGLVGLGLPTIVIALTSLVLPLTEAIALIALADHHHQHLAGRGRRQFLAHPAPPGAADRAAGGQPLSDDVVRRPEGAELGVPAARRAC